MAGQCYLRFVGNAGYYKRNFYYCRLNTCLGSLLEKGTSDPLTDILFALFFDPASSFYAFVLLCFLFGTLFLPPFPQFWLG